MALPDSASVERWVCAYIERELGVDSARFSRDLSLAEVGIDSIEAVRLVADLEAWLGRKVPSTLLWDCDTIGAFLDALLAPTRRGSAPTEGLSEPRSSYEAFVNPFLGRKLAQLKLDARFVRGEGCYLYDAEGRRVLDFLAQYGAVPFGHSPDAIWDAIAGVRARSEPVFVQPSTLDAAGELARRLVELAPGDLRYVTFTNSGAEAIEAAFKLCLQATGRRAILSTTGGFHGKTLGALSATGRVEYQEPFGLPLEGFDKIPYGDAAALERALDAHPERYAAFVVEPIQGEGGVVEPPPGYLARAQELCRARGVPLVVDEIQTGLGRTGQLFACARDGVEPDVLTLAKALGGGLVPVGACLCTPALYGEKFALKHSSTFAGNALAARVGLAVLDLLTRDGGALVQEVARNGAYLRSELERLARRFPELIAGVRGRGFLLGIELGVSRDRWPESFLGVAAEQDQLTQLVASYLLHVGGLRVAPTLNAGAVIRIEPPLVATRAQCAQAVAALERAFEVLDRGDSGELYASVLARRARGRPACVRPAPRSAPRYQDGDARFAFLVNPIDARSLADFDTSLQGLDRAELEEFADTVDGQIDPFVGSSVRVVSRTGRAVYGDFILLGRTAESLKKLPQEQALRELRAALALARERGAQIVGLGGFTSVVSRGGLKLAEEGIPLTSGNSYTVVASVDALALAQRELGGDFVGKTAAVVGGAGAIGRGAAALLAHDVSRLILVGNPARGWNQTRRRLVDAAAQLCRQISHEAKAGTPFGPDSFAEVVSTDVGLPPPSAPLQAFRDVVDRLERERGLLLLTHMQDVLVLADLVVTATSHTQAVIAARDLKPGAIVCDLSLPRAVSEDVVRARPDVLVVDGGLVELPGRPYIGPYGLERGLAYACMAETILLTMEQRFRNTSLGADLRPDEIFDQRRLARKHGLHIAELRSFGRRFGDDDWARLRAARAPAAA